MESASAASRTAQRLRRFLKDTTKLWSCPSCSRVKHIFQGFGMCRKVFKFPAEGVYPAGLRSSMWSARRQLASPTEVTRGSI